MASTTRFFLVLMLALLGACATTEPRFVSGDEWLEQEARRNDALAKVAEQSGSQQTADAFRSKAAENRAAKKVQPSVADALATSAFDALLGFFAQSLERRADK